jgi:hypothetical protein
VRFLAVGVGLRVGFLVFFEAVDVGMVPIVQKPIPTVK